MEIKHDRMIDIAEYPVIMQIAAIKTKATRLDARACGHLYRFHLTAAQYTKAGDNERDLIQSLGVELSF